MTDHDRHYPVGCASIVVADNERDAIELLDEALIERGLQPYAQHDYTLEELEIDLPRARILHDGNY